MADFEDFNRDDLLKNRKINRNRRFIEVQLSEMLGGYSKKKLQFERFAPGIPNAIQRAKKLPIDNLMLLNDLGTSVCILVEKIVKDNRG